MMNSMREKLIELFHEHNAKFVTFCDTCFADSAEELNAKMTGLANHLISNGVVVREKGEWKYYRKQGIAVCTSCSFERKLDENFGRAVACPNCGADMRRRENDG